MKSSDDRISLGHVVCQLLYDGTASPGSGDVALAGLKNAHVHAPLMEPTIEALGLLPVDDVEQDTAPIGEAAATASQPGNAARSADLGPREATPRLAFRTHILTVSLGGIDYWRAGRRARGGREGQMRAQIGQKREGEEK